MPKRPSSSADLPEIVPVFPLTGALLLPFSHRPLNIFEPRYIDMADVALAGDRLIGLIQPLGPWGALFLLYGFVLLCTEVLSNAAVAVLLTPLAVALADSLGVDARPFIVAVMMAASAAFATPFGYQTNVLVFQIGRYSYMDFVRVGLPMNLITWVVGGLVIPLVFPF